MQKIKQQYEYLTGNGSVIFGCHHYITSQKIEDEIGNISANCLQQVFGKITLSFIYRIQNLSYTASHLKVLYKKGIEHRTTRYTET